MTISAVRFVLSLCMVELVTGQIERFPVECPLGTIEER